MTTNNPFLKALSNTDGKTLIVCNGSKFAGQPLDDIAKLKEVLKEHLLCPRYLKFSLYQHYAWNPITPNQGELEKWRGAACFSGNFMSVSHVFQIITLDEELTQVLQQLINENIQRPEFIEAAMDSYSDHLIGEKDGYPILVPQSMVPMIAGEKSFPSHYQSDYYEGTSVIGAFEESWFQDNLNR